MTTGGNQAVQLVRDLDEYGYLVLVVRANGRNHSIRIKPLHRQEMRDLRGDEHGIARAAAKQAAQAAGELIMHILWDLGQIDESGCSIEPIEAREQA